MKDLMKKVYDIIICYEEVYMEAGKKLDQEVQELLKVYADQLNDVELENLKNMVYTIIHTAQYEGFKVGVKTAVQFVNEMKE